MRAMDSTEAGWERFAQADWEGARAAFAEALDERPGDPEALDGLGQALWWLGERDAAIERRRDAYAAYRRRNDARNAGRLATYLAGEHRIDGQHAAAAGWLARARRLLAGVPPGPETGWLAIEETKRASDPGRGGGARPMPRASSATHAQRSMSHTGSPIPMSSAWRSRSSGGRSCARVASTKASRCSTRR
jgi:tetratricopeptide (TPR) repeat protein